MIIISNLKAPSAAVRSMAHPLSGRRATSLALFDTLLHDVMQTEDIMFSGKVCLHAHLSCTTDHTKRKEKHDLSRLAIEAFYNNVPQYNPDNSNH